jgi:hypothetical protein
VTTEAGLRAVLIGGAGLGCVGALVELALAEHWGAAIQVVPFVLASLGLLAAGALAVAHSRRVVIAVRAAMVALVLGGAFGVWEHLEHNYGFEAEIRPEAGAGEVAWEALLGANPLLAPGMLAWIGLLGLGATWRHPILAS